MMNKLFSKSSTGPALEAAGGPIGKGRRSFLGNASGISGAALLTGAPALIRSAHAQSTTSIKFVLDWKLQGVHSWYYLAQERGYFKEEKIDLTIDQGNGSAASVTAVMAGSYQAGFGDMNAVVQNAATKPESAPVMVYMLYNRTPFALMTRSASPIRTIKDLSGKTLGSPAGGAAMRMFPVLAEMAGIDPNAVKWINMAPNLQEQMLLQGQVDASAVFSVTSYMNLVAQRLDPDRDIRWFHYADHGIDLYSNGVLVSAALRKERPEAVAGLVRAINRGVRDAIADPDAAIAAIAKVEPLINKDIEKRRLAYTLGNIMTTRESRALGLGDLSDERLARANGQLAKAFGLPRLPDPAEVFDRRFLPSIADRSIA